MGNDLPSPADDFFTDEKSSDYAGEVTISCPQCTAEFPLVAGVNACPQCGASLRQADPHAEDAATPSKIGKKVLVADDSLLFQKKIGAIFNKLGCTVLLAEDGKKAVSIAQQEKPDLIVLDVMMPELDGLETLYALKKIPACRNLPVVMITVKADPGTVAEALQAGIKDYIRKDSSPQELIMRLKKYC